MTKQYKVAKVLSSRTIVSSGPVAEFNVFEQQEVQLNHSRNVPRPACHIGATQVSILPSQDVVPGVHPRIVQLRGR